MYLLNKPTRDINKDVLADVVTLGLPETYFLEFKLALPDKEDKEKYPAEYLKDVSSFANSNGGLLIYGIATGQHKASKLIGLSDINMDLELRRLTELLRGIQPSLKPFFQPVPLGPDLWALVLDIPRSLTGPHMVTATGHHWTRGPVNAQLMTSFEIRRAILDNAEWGPAADRFRRDRARDIAARRPEADGRTNALLLHVLPLGGPRNSVNLPKIIPTWTAQLNQRLEGQLLEARPNLEGWMVATRSRFGTSHAQFFRADGGVEVRIDLPRLSMPSDNLQHTQRMFNGPKLEGTLAVWTNLIFDWFSNADVAPPFGAAVSVIGADGYRIVLPADQSMVPWTAAPDNGVFDREDTFIPIQIIDELPADGSLVLRPTFDVLWQAAGWDESPLHKTTPFYVDIAKTWRWVDVIGK